MPFSTLNEDGETIEAYTKEELDAIATEKEKLASELADREEHLKRKTEELAGLRGQNKRLADMSEEEKKRYSATELELKAKQEEIDNWRKNEHEGKRNAILDKLTGGNEELLKKANEHYGMISISDDTPENMIRRAQYAVNNARTDLGLTSAESLGGSFGTTGDAPTFGTKDGKRFADTEKGKALDKELFGDIANS